MSRQKRVSLADLAGALGVEGEVEKLRQEEEAAAAKVAEEKDRLRQEKDQRDIDLAERQYREKMELLTKWHERRRLRRVFACEVPDGYVTVGVHDGFLLGVLPVRYPDSDKAVILVPKDWVRYHGDFESVMEDGAHVHWLEEAGWAVVHGLNGEQPEYMFGGQLVLPYRDQLLMPPPGVWCWDLPDQIKRGEYKVTSEWVDIFKVLDPFLITKSLTYHGLTHWIRLDLGKHGRWYCHRSVPGLNVLLGRLYGQEAKANKVARGVESRLLIRVPRDDIGLWVGMGGSKAKWLASKLGVDIVQINPC